MGPRTRALALALATVGLAGLTLAASARSMPVTDDGVLDLALAQDCADGRGCRGQPSSLDVPHGRVLVVAIGAARRLGASVLSVRLFRDLTLVLAAVIVVGLAVFLHGARAGLGAAFVAALLAPFLVEHPVLWNPSVAPLPVAILVAATAAAGRDDGVPAVVVAGVAGAFACLAHPVHLVALPFALAVIAAGERPALRTVAAVAAFTGTLAIVDPGWAPAYAAAATVSPLGALAFAFPLGAALGVALGPRWRRLRPTIRARAVVYALGAVGAIVGVALGVALPFERVHYATLAAPAAACVGGAALARFVPRRPVFEAVAWAAAAVVAVFFARSPDPPRIGVEGWERVAAVAVGWGAPPHELGARLRGPSRGAWVTLAPMLAPSAAPSAGRPGGLRVLPWSSEPAPVGWRRLALPFGETAIVSPSPRPWCRRDRLEICAMGPARCRAVLEAGQPSEGAWAARLHETHDGGPVDASATEQRIEVTPTDAGPRLVALAPGWRLVRARGVSARALRPPLVELRPGDATVGVLVLRRDEAGAPSRHLAIEMELEPDEAAVFDDAR